MVYNSHNDFQQTNVIGEYLEEGIGGVTELFKNRVVIPFEGDYRKFRHVIHHELVHAVINDMFYGGSIQSIISNNITLQLPLWFNEGLSEYAALKWDTNSDMFLRDATINENLPTISQLYGYFAYRGGQSVFWYMSEKYGEQKIGELLNRIKSVRSVDGGFRAALGLSIEEFSERWQKEMKVLYWPDIAKREDPADYARRLTDHKKDGGFYNTSPAISPQGDRIAFITNRDDFFDVYIMNSVDGKIIEKLVDGQQTENLEELHLLTPGISWSPDGRRVALATKAGEEDAILLLQVGTSTYEKLTFGLQGIFSVAWSPRGDKLAFVGNKANRSDIFVYDLATTAAHEHYERSVQRRPARVVAGPGDDLLLVRPRRVAPAPDRVDEQCRLQPDGPVRCQRRHGRRGTPAGLAEQRRKLAGRGARRQADPVRVGPQRHQQCLPAEPRDPGIPPGDQLPERSLSGVALRRRLEAGVHLAEQVRL